LLISHWDNKHHTEVASTDMHKLLGGLGLEKHLTPSRNNGLAAIMRRIEDLVRP
jgi:cysteine desulfuration protein SufE